MKFGTRELFLFIFVGGGCVIGDPVTITWVDELTRYVIIENLSYQIMLLTKLGKNEKVESPIVKEIFVKLTREKSVLSVNLPEGLESFRILTTSNVFDVYSALAVASTFFLLVHQSRIINESAADLPKHLIDDLAAVSTYQYHPKFMILFPVERKSESLEAFLRYSWSKKFLDLTIVEWIEKNNKRGDEDPPTVHRFDPFKDEYTKIPWTNYYDKSITSNLLFPNKIDNMRGYPLNIIVTNSPPFSRSKVDASGKITEVGGPSIELLYLMSRKLNASLEFFSRDLKDIKVYGEEERYEQIFSRFGNASNNNKELMDVFSHLSIYRYPSRYNTFRTDPLMYVDFCAIVPIVKITTTATAKSPLSGNFIVACLFALAIVAIFFTVRKLLRFEVSVWSLFNITRVLFGVAIQQIPWRNVERLMFAVLLIVSAISSSNLYSALTGISLTRTREVKFGSFRSIDEGGLTPIVYQGDFNKTFWNAEGHLKKLQEKAIKSEEVPIRYVGRVVRFRNVTILLRREIAEYVMASIRRRGLAKKVKIAKVVFWSDNVSYRLSRRSPYRLSLNLIIRWLTSAGITKKIYDDANDKLEGTQSFDESPKEDNFSAKYEHEMNVLLQHLVTITLVGYSLSILAFIGEIFVHALTKHAAIIQKKKAKSTINVYLPYVD